MQTECNTERFDFQPLGKREIRGIFDGGAITSDAGALLLREGKPVVELTCTITFEGNRRHLPIITLKRAA